ncbi:hypothetical protein ACC691_38595, partial [Rhizobium johnstonii]
WQVLLLINVPIAVLAFIGIRVGIAADDATELHRDPLDLAGALLGTATIVLALIAPTLFVNEDPDLVNRARNTIAGARDDSAPVGLIDTGAVA